MNKKAMEITSTVNRWNLRASQNHDEYVTDIALIVYDDNYDVSKQENRISEHEKLSKIWKLANQNTITEEELVERTKEIVNM